MNDGRLSQEVIVHDLKGAAERAKVSEAVIRRWIADGMRAMPVGRVGARGPRDYRIFDSWLIAFMESRAVRAGADTPATAAEGPGSPASSTNARPRPARRPPATSGATPDGLWPRPGRKGGAS